MNVVAAANPSAREQGLPSPVPPGHFGSTRVGRAHLRLDMGEDTGFWGMLLNPDPHLSHPRVPGAGFWRWASRSSTFHGCAALLPSAGPGSAHPVSKGNSPGLAQAAPPSQHPKKMCCCNSPHPSIPKIRAAAAPPSHIPKQHQGQPGTGAAAGSSCAKGRPQHSRALLGQFFSWLYTAGGAWGMD